MNHQENSSNASRVKPFKSDEPENFVSYAEHEEAVIQLSASEKEVRRLRRHVAKLEQDQAVTEDTPEASAVKTLLDLWWREVTDSDKRVAHGLESTRAPKVRAALRRRKKIASADKNVADPDHAALDICRRAILGVTFDDWAMGRIKKSRGKAFNDIAEHILNSDGDIEKFAKLYDEHHPSPEMADELKQRRDRQALERGVENAEREQEERAGREAMARDRRLTFGDGLTPWDRFIGALRTAGSDVVMYEGNPDAFKAQCPAHDDRAPSLGVNRASDGRVLVICRAGCETADVLAALGLAFSDLFENADRDHGAKDFLFRVKHDPAAERPRYDYDRRPKIPAHLQRAMRDLLRAQEEAA